MMTFNEIYEKKKKKMGQGTDDYTLVMFWIPGGTLNFDLPKIKAKADAY